MGNRFNYYYEVERLIREEGLGYKEACQKAMDKLGIKKEVSQDTPNIK
jgi:hypothetical protein